MNREKMIDRLRGKISEKRFEHSIGVEFTAACLAMRYGEELDRARIAGLLHDCAKGIPTKDKILKAKKHGIPISKCEQANPDMLHAKLGAYYARFKYGVLDTVILDAIRYHTTGRPEMTLLDKIIFVADYIEPNRKPIKEIDIIRQEAFIDIDRCIIHILKNTLEYLQETTIDIDYMTQMTYNYYVNEKEKVYNKIGADYGF